MGALQGLLARYDGALMRPPEAQADPATITTQLAAGPAPALLDWCHASTQPWGAAALRGRGATALADALALQLDGSLRLQACQGAVARLALRLDVKLDDLALALGRRARRSDCWDSGWLHDPHTGLARLSHWQPRRATLLLATAPASAAPLPAAQLPAATPGLWARPVRLLWVDDTDAPLAWQPLR